MKLYSLGCNFHSNLCCIQFSHSCFYRIGFLCLLSNGCSVNKELSCFNFGSHICQLELSVLVTDRVLGGADTWATSQTIAGALRNLDYDLIITGRQAIDGDTAQVGPQISEHLGLPVISYAQKIREVNEAEKYIVVERQYDDRYHVVKAQLPCLLTALAELNEPRYMTPGGIFDAYAKEITVWGRKDLKDVEDSNLGLKGSPTQIAKASDKVRKGAGEKVELDPAASADYIVGKLAEKHII